MLKKIILFTIPILFLILLYVNRPILNLKECTIELKENIEFTPNDFIESHSNINLDEIFLYCDYEGVGEYEVTLTYKSLSKKTKLIIQDTTPPIFTSFQDSLSLYPNEEILPFFEASDLSPFELFIQEEIDTSKVQDTIIHIEAKDIYNNSSIKECHLIIKEKPKKKETISIQDSTIPTSDPIIESYPMEQTPIIEQPTIPENVCGFSGNIGNSGLVFNSYQEAIYYADSFLMENVWTYSGYSTEKIGCPDVWTVSFY